MDYEGLPRNFSNLLKTLAKEKPAVRNNKSLINEEINKFCADIPREHLVKTLKQLTESNNKITDSLKKDDELEFDQQNLVIQENWQFFKDALAQLSSLKDFQNQCKEVYKKLYATKYFTKEDLLSYDRVEETLQVILKEYFQKLTTEDPTEFIDILFSLPFDFVGLAMRYTVNTLVPEKREQLVPTKKEGQVFLKNTLKKRNEFIDRLNKIVNEQHNIFSITDASLLLDVRALIEDKEVYKGVIEYLVRMINKDNVREKLYDMFGKERIAHLKTQLLRHPNYVSFLKAIKQGSEQPYFTVDGLENKQRELNFTQAVEEYFNPELTIKRKEEERAVEEMPPTEELPTEEEPEEVEGEEGETPPEEAPEEAPEEKGEEPTPEEGAIEIPNKP